MKTILLVVGVLFLFHAAARSQVTQAQVDTLELELVAALATVEASVVEEVFSETLPVVGNKFATAYDSNVAAFRYLTSLREAVRTGLATLTVGPTYTTTQVSTAIMTRLTTAGFNTGTKVTVTTSSGQVQVAFETLDSFTNMVVPMALDFGLPNLDLDLLATANVSTNVNAAFNFTAGIDASGFYLETAAPGTLFTFNTTTAISTTLNAPVRFVKLPYRMSDDNSPRSSVTANFVISMIDPDASGKLRSAELTGFPDVVDATVAGQAAVNVWLTSDLNASAALPKIFTNLTLGWNYTTPQVVNADDLNATFGQTPTLALNECSMNVRSFYQSFATKLLRTIGDVTAPLQPLIDVLTTPIPLLSDLGEADYTMLDLMGATENEIAAIEGLTALGQLSSQAATSTVADNVWWGTGSYVYQGGDLRTQTLASLTRGTTQVPLAPPAGLTPFISSAASIDGLRFPILENGLVVANLLMGQPADLFSYRAGLVEIEEAFQSYYPVLGPVGVTLGGIVGVKTQFGFGFDSQGIFDYYAAGAGANPDLIFNGFYAMTLDENGNAFTGISLFAGITAGVEANLGIASVGVEGDITAEISMYLDDQLGDAMGRIRGNVLTATPLDDLFYASGRLTAGLRAYLELGISPFAIGVEFESPRVTLINFDSRNPEVPVLASPVDTTALVLNVGNRSMQRVYGDLDDRAEEFYITGSSSSIEIDGFGHSPVYSTPTKITGRAGLRGDSLVLAKDVPVAVEFHGGDGPDLLVGGASVDSLYGDAGPDRLYGNGGIDYLYGGEGNDFLRGGSGVNLLDGGSGDDTVSWDDAVAHITMDLRSGVFTGQAGLDVLTSIERYVGSPWDDTMDGSEGFDGLLDGEGGNDLIRGHGGADYLKGGSGQDDVQGGAGDDLLSGGSGADILDGGDGRDSLSYLDAMSPVTVSLLTGLGTQGEATGDVVSNFEILYGSGVPKGTNTPFTTGDILTGSHGADTIYAMSGMDTVHGAGGDDTIYGDIKDSTGNPLPDYDADRLNGDAGNDTIYGQWDKDVLSGGTGNDLLDGGTENDDLNGDEGNDTLRGGPGDDHLRSMDPGFADNLDGDAGYNRLSADYSDHPEAISFTVGPANAMTFPDGERYANLQTIGNLTTGSGDDVIRLAASAEPAYFTSKTIRAGAGNDLVIADSRVLYSFGVTTVRTLDNLHGDAGVDTISFEQSIGGVNVNLNTGGLSGLAAGLTMSGFENIIGSHFVDNLTGNAGDNVIYPLDVPRPTSGGVPSIDTIDGGNGIDTLVIDCSDQADANALGVFMTPNAVSGSEPISFGQIVGQFFPFVRYTYVNMERFNITGGNAADHLYGEFLANYPDVLNGRGGNDTLNTWGGDDFLDGGDGNDSISAGSGNDTVMGGSGNDSISFESPGIGLDIADAGPGDDVIGNPWTNNLNFSAAPVGTVFRCDGGEGYDALSANFTHQTQPIIWDESKPIDVNFSDSSYIRNIERLNIFQSGNGNDVYLLQSRENTQINLNGGNDVINPGLGFDTIQGGSGDDLVMVDYSVGDDADASGITWFSAFSPARHERRRLSDNVIIDQLALSTCERLHCTGTSKADQLYGLTGSDIILSGAGDDFISGEAGNDYLDGGLGADRMEGGPGNDFYLVDNVGDVLAEFNTSGFDQGGIDTVQSSVDFTLPAALDHINLTGNAQRGTGNALSNTLTGTSGANLLQGLAGADTLNGIGSGTGEVDRLNGGTNNDIFVLGDGIRRFYDDGIPANPGLGGYAIIEDFTPAQTDRLRLTGLPAEYLLGPSPIAGTTGMGLYHDSNSNGTLDPATDELIAVLQSPVALTIANTLTNSLSQAPIALASIGLTKPLGISLTSQGTAIAFAINETIASDTLIEIQSTTDLGQTQGWVTIASKRGTAAWSGVVAVTLGTASNGQIPLTVLDNATLTIPRQFYRVKVSPL